MTTSGGLTAEELLSSLRERHAAMPAEIGTFIVLEVCEALLRGAPLHLQAADVRIDGEGCVTLLGTALPAEDEASARSVHALLVKVLLTSRPGLPAALLCLVEEGPTQGRWALDAVRDDLEAALVPLNRLASSRVLARLLREADSGRGWVSSRATTPSFDELDQELGVLLGDEGAWASEAALPGAEGDRDAEDTLPDVLLAGLGVDAASASVDDPASQLVTSELGSSKPRERSAQPGAPLPLEAGLHEMGAGDVPGDKRQLWLALLLVSLGLFAGVVWLQSGRPTQDPALPDFPPVDIPQKVE